MSWRTLFRRREPWQLATGDVHPLELIVAMEEHLAFLERQYDFERDNELVDVEDAGRHPDIRGTDDLVLAYRRGLDVVKLTHNVLPGEGESLFLEWFPVEMPEARYTYTGLIEGEATRESYDRELTRMAEELRRSLEIDARHWKGRDGE